MALTGKLPSRGIKLGGSTVFAPTSAPNFAMGNGPIGVHPDVPQPNPVFSRGSVALPAMSGGTGSHHVIQSLKRGK